jgi:hypothetical protein
MRILKSIAAVAISVWLLGCSTASKPDTTAERQRMEALRRQLSQNTNDFRARTILAALLLKQGEAAAGYGELEIIARDAPAFSAESLNAIARLRDHQIDLYRRGLPVLMPVWSGYPLSGAGAMCISPDGLRTPANQHNDFCQALNPTQALVYISCGNTQFGSPGRTVQLIGVLGQHSCTDLGFVGEPVSPGEIDEALVLLGDKVPASFARQFRAVQ